MIGLLKIGFLSKFYNTDLAISTSNKSPANIGEISVIFAVFLDVVFDGFVAVFIPLLVFFGLLAIFNPIPLLSVTSRGGTIPHVDRVIH